ncbi:long-chain fatty acid--CoA ligase [Dactylosporangium aurantiacum]|uniref:Acyl-CoA synthetase n=1 Tax=Dactylosporangium aurantiacum TaxID=35754 RepID=A0A9Q9I6L2_9ACTN|nr:AMP-dependent synthetase/ligase [Dactylosporangium aurantiacum]MDG6106363.1 AMP-dependent synthetase/ligase [Dactylosporangium aurantiacum]UWZ50594.1 long-chain fatty acid--CoA ligase [Dactylosporangium aurantiacum]
MTPATVTQDDLAQRFAATADGLTIPALLDRNARDFGDLPALSTLGGTATLTWRQVRDRVAALTLGLHDAGLRPGDRVLMLMSSRPEHWLVDLAAVHLGAVPSTAYATLSGDQLRYLAEHSQARVVVVENAAQLDRVRAFLGELPAPLRVVMVDGPADAAAVPLDEIETAGAAALAADGAAFERLWRAVRPEQPVTLLYTSGTTGDPKGVLLSHRNVVYQAVVLEATVPVADHSPALAYLPLAHIAERMLGIYNAVYRAGHVTICPDPAQLAAGLAAVRPVSFFGVPRVWEKMAAGIQAFVAAADPAVRAAFEAASTAALQAYELREAGRPVPEELAARVAALDAQVLRPVRARLGLDRVGWAGSGSAPIPVAVLRFLAGCGLDVLEVWGMTETTGTATINAPDAFRTGTVGRVNPGMRLRLAEDGEIMVRGPLVCLGYLRADGGVEPATDAAGWLATGDVGMLDEDGFLTITDRKKELIITSSGKNIAPAQLENLLRAHPLIGQAVAIGDRRPYVTALIVLDEEMAPAWAGGRDLSPDLAELSADPVLLAEIQAAVDAANARLSRPEQIKTFRVLPAPWSPVTGEITPTLKLRRRVIAERYADVIDGLYT